MALKPAGGQRPAPVSSQTNIRDGRPGGKSAPGTTPAQVNRPTGRTTGSSKKPR